MIEKEPWNKFDIVEAKPEISPIQKAVIEAMQRVEELGDPHELIPFVVGKSPEELSEYLEKNAHKLSPQEMFYLESTIEFRKTERK